MINPADSISDQIDKIAYQVFHFESLKHHQRSIIEDVLAGHDILVVSPTGSGKSLCYQIPALLFSGTFIVISPLIALMNDQVHQLKCKGIAADCLHSNMDKEQQLLVLQQLKQQKIKLLYISPERLIQPYFLNQLQSISISGFAIDEAHCILHWGQDFRPEYEQLTILKTSFPNIPVLAFTATATPKQQQDIIEQLQIDAKKHIYATYKEHIGYEVIQTNNLKTTCLKLCHQHPLQAGIIYCSSRQRVESLYQYLNELKLPVLKYHAGLSPEQKEYHQALFMQDEPKIMIATMAFGMGVDKKNIRYIVHYDVPGRLDQFIQESGRAGRDSETAKSYLLYYPELFFQFNLWRIQKANPWKRYELIHDLKIMAKIISLNQCIKQSIFDYFEHIKIPACGECHACINPQHECKEDTLKLLSCIYRMKQDAHWDKVTDVMMGILHNKTIPFKTLSTFSIGQHQTKWYWFDLLCRLYAKQWIEFKFNHQVVWSITPTGLYFLKHQKLPSFSEV
jgi:ATP-dependent DNA helicase RecQ